MQQQSIAKLKNFRCAGVSKNPRLNAAALQCADDPISGSDLDDGDILSRLHAKMFECQARSGMERSSVAADTQVFAAQLLGLFDLRTYDQVLQQRSHIRRYDFNVGPADRRS